MSKFIDKLSSKKWFRYTSSIIINLWTFIMFIFCFMAACSNFEWQNNPDAIAFPLWISIVMIIFLSILLFLFLLFSINWIKESKNKTNLEFIQNKIRLEKVKIIKIIFFSALLIFSTIMNIWLAVNSISLYDNIGGFVSPIGIIFEAIIYLIFAIISVTYYAFLIKKLLQKPKEELKEDVNKEVNE